MRAIVFGYESFRDIHVLVKSQDRGGELADVQNHRDAVRRCELIQSIADVLRDGA